MNKTPIEFKENDGGRKAAGYVGVAGDCVCRAICIASGRPYQEVYDHLANGNATQRKSKHHKAKEGQRTARKGISVNRKWFQDYMEQLGFKWIPTMLIGQGCKVHLRADELPKKGRLVVAVSKHYTAVIDGVLNDTYECSREGTRCVYGYYIYTGGFNVKAVNLERKEPVKVSIQPVPEPTVKQAPALPDTTLTMFEIRQDDYKEKSKARAIKRLAMFQEKKKRWTTKLKRATNALKKIEQSMKYITKTYGIK